MDITYILLKENPLRDSEALNKDIDQIIYNIGKITGQGLSPIKAIYAEDVQPDPNVRASLLTLYLKWDSEDNTPLKQKHKMAYYEKQLTEGIPYVNAAILRELGSNLIKVDFHYFIYNKPPKKSKRKQ